MARTRVDKYVAGNVASGATSVDTLAEIPSGQVWRLMHFGGAAPQPAIVGLQVNTGSGWQTMRATAGTGQADDFLIDRDYTGDGTVRFRIVRQNLHSATQQIVAWLEAFKRA